MKANWVLILILLLAGILRIVGIDSYPVGFTPDEASFGYDAYSIIKTGKDQWGKFLPLVLESFGDGKLPLYTYLAVPTVALFGLNEFAVRLPSAIIGLLAVLAVYLLASQLFKNKMIGIASSLVLALSPWHISLSRGAFEANLTVFFMTFASALFLQKKYVWSAVFFGLNLFSYHSARLVTPLIILGLYLLENNKLELKKYTKFIVVIAGFLLIAMLTIFMGGATRVGDVTIFNPTDKWQSVFNDRYSAIFAGEPYLLARIFNNKFTYIFDQLTNAYSTYISPQFLFTMGPSESTYGMVPGVGLMHIFEFIFLIFFAYKIFTTKYPENKPFLFLIFWYLIAILPAAVTKGPGYAANRAAIAMPAVQIMAAYGLYFIYEKWFLKYKKVFWISILSLYLISLLFFLEIYVFRSINQMSDGMLYGRKEVVEYLKQVESKYDKIVVSRSLSEPQIYIAFYLKFDPATYHSYTPYWNRYKEQGLPFLDQLGEYSLGKYLFKSISYYDYTKDKSVLLVGKPSEFPDKVNPEFVVKYPNSLPAIYVVNPYEEN